MNKYCVAYINFFDNVLKQEIVEANSKVEAAVSYLGWESPDDYDLLMTFEELVERCYDMDSTISVLQIDKTTKGGSGNLPRPWMEIPVETRR